MIPLNFFPEHRFRQFQTQLIAQDVLQGRRENTDALIELTAFLEPLLLENQNPDFFVKLFGLAFNGQGATRTAGTAADNAYGVSILERPIVGL